MLDPSFPGAKRVPRLPERIARLLGALPNQLRRPVASGAYRAEIDGLRFIAIAVVVVGHFMERATRFFPVAGTELGRVPFGDLLLRPGLGVFLFFAISGFIITRQAIKGQGTPLSPRFLKSYFGRRVLRIEPPYIVLLVASWLLLAAGHYTPDQTNHFDAVPHSLGASLVGSIFYLHDLVWGTYPRLFPPGWSLEIEVQFYLLAPLLFWTFFNAKSVAARTFLGALGLGGGALLSLMVPDHIGAVHTSVSIMRFFHFFWLGIVLAHLHGWIVRKTEGLSATLTGCVGWIGLACYLVMPNAPDDNLILAMAIRAATLVALSAMFVSAFAPRSGFRAFCQRPWISVIGGACYSIYLTHLQAIQVMTSILAKATPHAGLGLLCAYLVVETAVVIAVGMVFYAVIERTFMIKDWPQQAWTRLRALFSITMLGVRRPRA